MKRFNKITLIYTLHVIVVLGGVALASYLTYLSNGYFEDPILNGVYCAMVLTFYSFFVWVLSFLFFRILLRANFSLNKTLIFKTSLAPTSKNEVIINDASTFYISNFYNLKTIATHKIDSLDINNIKNVRTAANNKIKKKYKKANSFSIVFPHWSKQYNIFIYNGVYKMSKVFTIVRELNQDKHFKENRVNYFYLTNDQLLIMKTYDAGKFSLWCFLCYRSAIRKICKQFHIQYKELLNVL